MDEVTERRFEQALKAVAFHLNKAKEWLVTAHSLRDKSGSQGN